MTRPAPIPCPECCGSGWQYIDRADMLGEHYTVQVACDNCDGGGEVEATAAGLDDAPTPSPEVAA